MPRSASRNIRLCLKTHLLQKWCRCPHWHFARLPTPTRASAPLLRQSLGNPKKQAPRKGTSTSSQAGRGNGILLYSISNFVIVAITARIPFRGASFPRDCLLEDHSAANTLLSSEPKGMEFFGVIDQLLQLNSHRSCPPIIDPAMVIPPSFRHPKLASSQMKSPAL